GSDATVTLNPRPRSPSTITCVSSLQSAPRSVVSPSPNAARTRARLVMLLEPGTVISASTGFVSGTISIRSGKDTGFKAQSSKLKAQEKLQAPTSHGRILTHPPSLESPPPSPCEARAGGGSRPRVWWWHQDAPTSHSRQRQGQGIRLDRIHSRIGPW